MQLQKTKEEVPLEIQGSTIGPLGATFSDGLAREDWAAMWPKIRAASAAMNWVIGDWMNHGLAQWGDKYAALVVGKTKEATVAARLADTCAKVGHDRRRPELTFEQHKEVADAEPLPEQQELWLDKAVRESWSVPKLRKELRLANKGAQPSPPPFRLMFNLTQWSLGFLRWAKRENPAEWDEERRAAIKTEIEPVLKKLMEIYEILDQHQA